VIYPLQTAIRDDGAFNNRGYVFRFAFPVLIDHNEGNRDVTGHAIFESEDTYVDYCTGLAGQEYDIRALGTDKYVITNAELNDIELSYNCHKFVCPLGNTTADQGTYRLRTRLPASCSYGYLIAEKPGYLKNEVQVLDNANIDIPLKKLKGFDFEVVKHKSNNLGEMQELADYEEAIITIQSKDQADYSIFAGYDSSGPSGKIDLIEADSTYNFNILVTDTVDDVLIGGYNGDITIDYDEMQGKEKIIFHVVEYLPKPLSTEEQYALVNYLESDEGYKVQLRPGFE